MSKKIVKNIFENADDNKIAITSENKSQINYKNLKIFINNISKQLS